MIKTTTINNVATLLMELDNIKVRCDFVKEEKLLYRGQGNTQYELIPSIGRRPNGSIYNSLTFHESDIYEEARKAFPIEFSDDLSPIDFLIKLQHYGIPTRLLDVSESPLIALFFACDDGISKDNEGELIVFKNTHYRPTYDAISEAIADTANIDCGDLNEFLEVALSKSYFNNEREIVKKKLGTSKDKERNWIIECCSKPIYIHRAFLTNRQQNQLGGFLLFSNKIVTNENTGIMTFSNEMKPIDKNDEEMILHRFIIPKDKKNEILEQLNMLGINKRTLFSDSIDIVCKEIKKHYESRYKIDF